MLHLIGGEKGGVGKSVLARLLCQYHIDNQKPFIAFDADLSHPALARYYSDYSRPVDIQVYESCDRLLTSSLEGSPVIVDLPAQSNRPLTQWMEDSGVQSLAHELDVRIVRWHVMDDGKDSLNLLEELMQSENVATDYIIVQNYGCGRDFRWMESSEGMRVALKKKATIVEIPALHQETMNKIDHMDASFWAASHNSNTLVGPCLNILERQRVKVWVERTYREFNRAHASLAFNKGIPAAEQMIQFVETELPRPPSFVN